VELVVIINLSFETTVIIAKGAFEIILSYFVTSELNVANLKAFINFMAA
jgi:hypothetical protein